MFVSTDIVQTFASTPWTSRTPVPVNVISVPWELMTAEENNATDIVRGGMLQEQGHNYENFLGSSLGEGVFAHFK
jgi:hypothetical protein